MARYFIDRESKTVFVVPDDYTVIDYTGEVETEVIEVTPLSPAEVRKNRPDMDEVKSKKQRHCKNCGKPGHRKDNCPTDLIEETTIVVPEVTEETSATEEDLVVEIRNLWVVDGENAHVVANKLGITLSKFNAIVQKHGLHR